MINQNVKELISKASNNSGVYCFVSENKTIIYVGKAKNLKKRLSNYLLLENLSTRIRRMVLLACDIEIIITQNELEALLLEHNLIKKISPKFNILLKDDKTFASIEINNSLNFPAVFKHRGVKNKNNIYFGPFASTTDISRVIDALKKSFLLRSCLDSEFKSRKKPCLEYQIKKCSAPCVSMIKEDDYKKSINMAIDFLNGKSIQIQKELSAKMQNFSDLEMFEKAAIVRDKIKSLSSIQAKQNVNLSDVLDIDIINIVSYEEKYCIYISFYRKGNNYGSKPYFYNVEDDIQIEEFLSNFLCQFYLKNQTPSEILLNIEIKNNELIESFLEKISGYKIQIKTPKSGDKYSLVQDYENIAKSVLVKKIEDEFNEKELLIELKNLFHLAEIPKKIEVYDNSHISGDYAVGVLIASGLNGFIKSDYRKYNIALQSLENKDDTAMLKEVLRRRFKNLECNNLSVPDFIIIDGGLPQLSATTNIFNEIDIKIPFVCMSKGANRNAGEEFFHQNNKTSFTLEKNSRLMHYLQRLRDEAHRFAISSHRIRRKKSVTKSALDEIKNIGSKRKKALLNHFGSIDKIKSATIQDLTKVSGINISVAKKIQEFFM